MRNEFPQLGVLQKALKPGSLCLINRLNQYLFSSLCEEDNDLGDLVDFKGSAGYLTVGPKKVILWLDGRYWESHKHLYKGSFIECYPSLGEQALRQYLKQGYLEAEGQVLRKIFCNTSKWSALDIERFRRVVPRVEWEDKNFSEENKKPVLNRGLVRVDESISGETSEKRLKRVQNHIRDNRLHFICNPDDISWLLNIRANDFPYKRNVKGLVLVAKHYAALFTDIDKKKQEELQAHSPGWLIISKESTWKKAIQKLMDEYREIRLEVEFHRRPGSLNQADYKFLTELFPGRRLIRRKRSLVELGRIDKNPHELQSMENSGTCLSKVMQLVIEWVKTQVKEGKKVDEQAVKKQVLKVAKSHGATRACFPPIVASGEHSTSPHHMYGNRMIEEGDMVMMDIGFYFNESAYSTDMTRSFCVSESPTQNQKSVYTSLLKAFLLQWNQHFKQGELSARDLDQIGRTSLASTEREGYAFCHSTGHGVGIVDHELAISISSKSKMILRPNFVYSIEPGCYANEKIKGERFGIRIEDVVVVVETENDNLTHNSLAPCPFETNLIDFKDWSPLDQERYDAYQKQFKKT